jgi:protein regulator of cytokinesis 1
LILSLSFYLNLLLSLVPFAQHQHCSGIDQQERDDFFAINEAGLGNKEIEACQSELAKLITLKKERVRPMIENERSAILDLWRKLYFSEEQKAAFEAFYVNEDMFNEEILEKHEEYNKELTEQWKEQEPIMLKIEKREKILTYPAKLKEPLKTRKDIDESTGKSYTSGAISKLNKKRAGMTQMVKKVLPKIETELVELLANWKHKYGTDIMIEGDVYLETIQESIANRENLLRKKKNAINENAMRKYSVAKVNRKTLGTR